MLAVLLLLAGTVGTAETPGREAVAPTQAPAPEPRAAPRLRLGMFGYRALRPEPAPTAAPGAPRFDTRIDVQGFIRPEPNETMKLFWRRWNLDTSIYGRGIDIQETRGGAFNILPLFDWGWKKMRADKDKSPPLDLEEADAAPSP
jgi:hypothetical protein